MDASFLGILTVVIAVVTVMATGYAYFRSSAVKVWEQNSKAYRARVELLEEQNRELSKQINFLEHRIHELEARPDWQQVVALMTGMERNILNAVRAMHDDTLAVSKGG